MGDSKLVSAFKFADKLSHKRNNSKKDFQELIGTILEAVQEIECCLDGHLNNSHRSRLKLCLLQLQYTINKIAGVLNGSTYIKTTVILTLLNKKICLCLKEALNLFHNETASSIKNNDLSYHSIMVDVLSSLSSPQFSNDFNELIDNLLCSSLTIAKLSTLVDFKEINASCKNILNAMASLKGDDSLRCENDSDLNSSHLLYQVKFLERKVNSAMLRLFLHIMCYPQGSLKNLIIKCGSSSKLEKYSEDLDDEVSEFDMTCDRIALIGNFAIKSCEQESVRIKVQNCLANLEFCEESLVPACIDYYMEPNLEKREFLKYLSNEWKSEVLILNSLLDSIVDPAAFSLVVFEDLFDLIQRIKSSEEQCRNTLYQEFFHRCLKLTENISKSPDCLADSFLVSLKKSLISELKNNENKNSKVESLQSKIPHLEVILSLIDQISEHLNKILNCSSSSNSYITHSTLKDISLKDSGTDYSYQQNNALVSKEWNTRCQEKHILSNDHFVPNCYLEKVQMCSPFVFTLYQKTPVKRKFKDNVALTLDISKNLCQSFDA